MQYKCLQRSCRNDRGIRVPIGVEAHQEAPLTFMFFSYIKRIRSTLKYVFVLCIIRIFVKIISFQRIVRHWIPERIVSVEKVKAESRINDTTAVQAAPEIFKVL